jgi:hypothetical protein
VKLLPFYQFGDNWKISLISFALPYESFERDNKMILLFFYTKIQLETKNVINLLLKMNISLSKRIISLPIQIGSQGNIYPNETKGKK